MGFDGKREKKRSAEWAAAGGSPDVLTREAIAQYKDPTQGMDQLSALIQSQMSRAMPQLDARIQSTRENAIQRGISTGDLGTTYEGDVMSAFQQNLADSIAGQTFDLYSGNRNTYLDLIHGERDREDTNRNAGKNRSASLWGAGINAVSKFIPFMGGGG